MAGLYVTSSRLLASTDKAISSGQAYQSALCARIIGQAWADLWAQAIINPGSTPLDGIIRAKIVDLVR